MENQMETAPVMSLKDWVITLLVSAIPLIGLVMLFVWAFGSGNNPNKVNFARASLIWAVVVFVLSGILYFLVLAAFLGNALSS